MVTPRPGLTPLPRVNSHPFCQVEDDEISRRSSFWVFYLFRSPFYEAYARGYLSALFGLLARVPVVGVFLANVEEPLATLQHHYFYTAASSVMVGAA